MNENSRYFAICHDMPADNNSVRVALRIRPQSARERAEHTNICTFVVPGVPQITIGDKKSFTYDHVFDQTVQQKPIYDACIHELVEGAFDGYNATVLAYGQTGSGKTYTMGTSFDPNTHDTGIIPRAAAHIFEKIDMLKVDAREKGNIEPQFEVSVQFIELYNEEIIDLLAEDRHHGAIKIHEDPVKGEILLKGVTGVNINSAAEILESLQTGALNRTTAATNMNQQSSRSHAIFTVQIKQQRMVAVNSEDAQNLSINGNAAPLTEVEMLTAKFHFVDLAGSERLKRTGATGERAKEGISINSGLLALGNVISALGGGSGRVQHVPYRDSKLTRLLQDSLGGNSRTLMIACASPCDSDFVETLNTLNYANRAKNIKNKVVANQDKSSKLIGEMRTRIAVLEAELNEYRQGKKLIDENGQEVTNDQYLENVSLQHEVNRLRIRLNAMDETCNMLKQRCARLTEELELKRLGISNGAASAGDNDTSITTAIRGYLEQIQELQSKVDEERLVSEELRKQNNRIRAQAQSMSSYPNSPYDQKTANLIKAAKREIKKQKRLVAQQSAPNENEKKEATNENEKEGESETSNSPDLLQDEEESEPGSCEDEEDTDTEEVGNNAERDRICNDLVSLQDDISVQEALVRELELKEQAMIELRRKYEKKLSDLSNRITSMEAERDKILSEMTSKSSGNKHSQEKIQQVREDYERRLGSLRSEYNQLKQVQKENRRMQAEQARSQAEMQRIKNEILVMKRNKVELMNKLKEENKRNREAEIANRKRVAAMEKAAIRQQFEINRLQRDANTKAEAIKRKTEECQRLREKQRQTVSNYRSNRFAATIAEANADVVPSQPTQSQEAANATYSKTPTINFLTPKRKSLLSAQHNATFTYSPVRAKRQWVALDKAISRMITRRQNISNREDELERRLNERHKAQTELERMKAIDRSNFSAEQCAMLDEQCQSVGENIEYISSEILRLQNEIVEFDVDKEEDPDVSTVGGEPSHIVEECENLNEAKYLLNHLLSALVSKSLEAAKADYSRKELAARLQQKEIDSVLISQLLMDSEQDKANKENEVLLRKKSPQSSDARPNTDKVRRRTATSEELLYATTQYNEGKTEVLEPIPETSMRVESSMNVARNGNNEFAPKAAPATQHDDAMKRSGNSNYEDDFSLASSAPSSSAPPFSDKSKLSKSRIVECEDVPHTYREDGPFLKRVAIARNDRVLCVHASSQRFITGGRDRMAAVWDLNECVKVGTLGKHPNNVAFVRLLPDETHCAITGSLYIAKVWDLRTNQCVRQLYSSGIVCAGDEGNNYVERTNEVVQYEHTIYACTTDPESKFLFTTYGSGVRIWSLSDFVTVTTLPSSRSSDVSTLATCSMSSNILRVACGSRDGTVGIYDFNPYTRCGASRDFLSPPHLNIVSAMASLDNKLFSASRAGDIMYFNSQDFKRNHMEARAHERAISGMSIFHNQNVPPYLISGCRGGELKVWDVHSSSRMHLVDKVEATHSKGIRDLCCNSQLVFTAGDDDTVAIWKPTE